MVPDEHRTLVAVGEGLPSKDEAVARWTFAHREAAGAGTQTLPAAGVACFPVLVPGGIVGVLAIRTAPSKPTLSVDQSNLLKAFVGLIGSALERSELASQAEKVRLEVETEKLRNSLLSAVSHDLRTPLATITGSASLLADSSAKIDEQGRRELAESMYEESERLNRLVGNLLDLTRLEAGGIALERVLQPIEEVIGVVLERMERQLRDRAVTTTIEDDLPPVPIDGILIQQVLVNLLDNADRYSPEGAPIDLSALLREDKLVVEVADRGPGLPPGLEKQVFEKFYRAPQARAGGSGIGLAICRGIIVLHGGEIAAENRPGGGAVFRFTLPLPRKELPGFLAEEPVDHSMSTP
jgi:two-component system sensor histidine kinase KdpD